MKKISYILSFCLFTAVCSDHVYGAIYFGPTITEYDLVGCKSHPRDPRCRKIIKVACSSICKGHEEESTDFGSACNTLCTQLKLREDLHKKDNKNEPKSRLH